MLQEKMKKLSIIIVIFSLFVSCGKTLQQKSVKKWEGKWKIINIEGADFTEDNPFGYIEFFKDGTGQMQIKNLDYSAENDNLVIEFVMNHQYSKSHIYLYGMRITNVENAKLPCSEGAVTFLVDDGFFGKKRTVKLDQQSVPSCTFPPREWTIKKEK